MAFEVVFIVVIGVIAVACGRPIVQAYSDKMKASFKEMEPKQVTEFKARISDLEEQLRQVKKQLENVQGNSRFRREASERARNECEIRTEAQSIAGKQRETALKK